MSRLLTVSETSEQLSLSESAVRSMIDLGKLPTCRIGPKGGSIRIREEDLAAYVASTRHRKTAPTRHQPRTTVSDLASKYFPKLYERHRS